MKLKNDAALRESHFLRQKRLSLDLENNACEVEQRYEDQLKECKANITELNNKIKDLRDKNSKLTYDLKDHITVMENSKDEIKSYKDLVSSMRISIDTLNEDNKVLATEVEDLKVMMSTSKLQLHEEGLKSLHLDKKDAATSTEIEQTEKTTKDHQSGPALSELEKKINKETECMGKNKIVFLTDDYGKRLLKFLTHYLNRFCVQLITKPSARFKDLVFTADCYVNNLSCNDYVVVLAGINDNDIRLGDITLLANKCFHTNLIICNLPYKNDSADISYKIQNVNNKLSRISQRLKQFSNCIDFLDLSNRFFQKHFIDSTLYLNNSGLSRLAYTLKVFINNFQLNNCINNLIYVSVSTDPVLDVSTSDDRKTTVQESEHEQAGAFL